MHDDDPLCCCEYFSLQNERTHILQFCCNCDELDQCVDRLLTCRKVPKAKLANIMTTLQDRLRVPWPRGGARQVSLEAVLPIVILPILACISCQGPWWTVAALGPLPFAYCFLQRILLPRSRFFFAWASVSVIFSLLVFEISVVPLLEILPLENIVLMTLTCTALLGSHFVRIKAASGVATALLPIEGGITCAVCRKRVPPRSHHCYNCQTCVINRIHHCVWLDCCIGESNWQLFLLSLVLGASALIYGAVLTLTSVCHPFFFLNTILLPDDCGDVYHDFEIAICFVCAVYCLLMATGVIILLLHHLYYAVTRCLTFRNNRSIEQ